MPLGEDLEGKQKVSAKSKHTRGKKVSDGKEKEK